VRLRPDVLLLAALLCGGCRTLGDYIWVDDVPIEQPRSSGDEYVIAVGDLLSVRVWNQDAMSARVRVRTDGRISLPFLNDVEAAGSQPAALARRIQTRLKDFVVNPVVTISLEEPKPVQVSVLGEVTRPGVYTMEPNAGVLNAIAAAGGMTSYASKDRIFVLRRGFWADNPKPARIRFTYQALSHVQGRAAAFRLKADDVVVVE
jgi:polysaccharide export outer membrane protein